MSPTELREATSATRERLLGAAQALMLAKGFSATTIEDICAAAKVTKGGFFHYFESKDELGTIVLKRFCESGQALHQNLCGRETDPLKRVYAYLDNMIKLSQDPVMSQGCLLGLFAQELATTNSAIRKACCEGFSEWAKGFAKELAAAKAKYAPRKSFDPDEVAEHLVAVTEGAMILGKSRKDMRVMAPHLRHFKAYVKSLYEG